MKLVDLEASFIGRGGPGITDAEGRPVPERHGLGLSLKCPCGGESCNALYVPFANPIDGGPPDDDDPRRGWQRTGETLETLTLRPSVLRLSDCGWHGFITNGEAVRC